MVVASSSAAAGMAFFFTIWGTNLATDCFRICRAAFARISGNIYAEKIRKLRAWLDVMGNRHKNTTNWEVLPRIFKDDKGSESIDGIRTMKVSYLWIVVIF